MSKAFSLAKIFEEVILEVGDLEKIPPYELDSNDKFETDSGIIGKVFIQDLEEEDLFSLKSIPQPLSKLLTNTKGNKLIYNIGFSVNKEDGETEQKSYDTSLSELLRIYKTVLDKVKSIIIKDQPLCVFIFAALDSKANVKSEIYWRILNNNIPTGYRAYSGIKLKKEVGGTEGSMILRNR